MYEKLFAEQTRQSDFFTKNCLYDGDEDQQNFSSRVCDEEV